MADGLHPNLARIAAAYDDILRRMTSGQIPPEQAEREAAQLEARDDNGVRWSIDPASGNWLRKTAFGDIEFDPRPPTFGVTTPDAFTYTPNPRVMNPNDAVTMVEVAGAVRPTDRVRITSAASRSAWRRPALIGAAFAAAALVVYWQPWL